MRESGRAPVEARCDTYDVSNGRSFL